MIEILSFMTTWSEGSHLAQINVEMAVASQELMNTIVPNTFKIIYCKEKSTFIVNDNIGNIAMK